VQNFLKIGSGVPELEDPEKWHFPLKAFITLTTVHRTDCDKLKQLHPTSLIPTTKKIKMELVI